MPRDGIVRTCMDAPPPVVQVDGDAGRLIVIGASAGGIEALLAVLAALPADLSAPIVVAQHIDPLRESHLGEVLAARTPLAVHTVDDRAPLQPGVVYLPPAGRDLEVTAREVVLRLPAGGSPKPSIDRLLSSAAHVYGDNLISVVLTGSGSDGALGAQAVKAHGGAVIIQNPETAKFPDMPLAVPPSAVDIVADIDAIAPLVVDLLSGDVAVPAADEAGDDDLRAFLGRVRERTGLDFDAYKRPTIARRLQRRMAAAGAATLADYRRYVERHPEELQLLVATFLIKVTDFFRDPEFFAYLRDQVLPGLIEDARQRGELRLWSAGCATGEEPYSLAMLVADLLADGADDLPVRLFATDVATEALDFARRGVYPEAALDGLPRDLRDRHFAPTAGVWEVRPPIRGMVVFGEHDLANRAPFPRIDLVLCRNVLIYFTPELQRRALQLFAFSLRQGGCLALGKAETVSPLPEYFSFEQPRLKIVRRVGDPAPIPPNRLLPTPMTAMARVDRRSAARRTDGSAAPAGRDAAAAAGGRLLDRLPVGVVTVDRGYHIRAINAAARRLLGIRSAALDEDLIHRASPELATTLRQQIDRALRGEAVAVVVRVAADLLDEDARDLRITAAPLDADDPRRGVDLAIVTVEDCTQLSDDLRARGAERDRLAAEAERAAARAAAAVAEVRELRGTNLELANQIAVLRAEHEDLQVANEEAQAAAEEIETLNEELQATNEELETLNEELQATVEELSATNDELQARTVELSDLAGAYETERQRLEEVLQQAPSGMIVMDGPTHVVRFANDAGLTWLGRSAPEVLRRPAAEVLGAEQRRWLEVIGRVYASGEPWTGYEVPLVADDPESAVRDVIVQPLRHRAGGVQGVLYQTADAGERVEARRQRELTLTTLAEERARLGAILAAMADAVLVVGPDGDPILANAAHERLFGGGRPFAPQDDRGRPLPPEQWPDQRAARGESFVVQYSLATGEDGRRWFEASGQPVHTDGGLRWGVVVVRDITERSLRRLQEQFIAVAGHELRTPLTVLYGSLQLAERAIDKGDRDRQRSSIGRALTQARRLEAHVAELMDVARMQQGTFRLERTPLDLAALAARVGDLARILADDRPIVVEAPEAPLVVDGDERRLEQVILNLVTNAMTHAPGAEPIVISARQEEDRAVLAVRDRGPGIPAAALPHVFDRFYQGSGDGSVGKGLGLGLFIAREIVVGHGGAIEATSVDGAGATFTVTLPLAPAAEAPAADDAAAGALP
jgi:two-component system CheB/CheR fusion protein